MRDMPKTQTVEAVYESGVLRPLQTLSDLPEHSKVKITIECEQQPHPLQEFFGILSDEEAAELQRTIAEEFGKVYDRDGW